MRFTTFAAAALMAGCAGFGGGQQDRAHQALHTLMADTWQAVIAGDPYFATQLGLPGSNDRHPDFSPEGRARIREQWRDFKARLDAIDRDALDADGQVNYDLYRALVEDNAGGWARSIAGVNGHAFEEDQMPIDPLFGGPQHFSALLPVTPFDSEQDYANYLARLATLDIMVEQVTVQMRRGMKSGWTRPKPVVERVIGQVEGEANTAVSKHSLYAPFKSIPNAVPAGQHDNLRAAARGVLEKKVLPALRRFHDFLKDEYLPAARTTIGASDLPGGADYYAFSIRRHITTNMTADEIHAIGLSEAKRLRAEMQEVMAEVGFKGSIPEYGKKLREDPRFRYQTGAETLAAHRALAKQLDPMMAKMFGTLPRAPYGVEPMPEASALSGGAPYYNPPSEDGSRGGAFYINTHKPELQPAYDVPSLVAHEAVPGHHLQVALAKELKGLPQFRQNAYYTAYSEGWALYAENLAGELGIYRTPEERFGALTAEIWRAVRLVVDTGIHAKGWSRQQAIDYFAANAPSPMARIEAEVDRYIAWPGQALGYKVGQLKIWELRREAEAALGERFELRAFHDELLGAGSMPLSVLEQRMDAWVARQS